MRVLKHAPMWNFVYTPFVTGDIYIPRDPYTFESRGFAFVRYCTDREADCAIRGMDGHKVDGREVRVQRAKYGRPTPNRRS
ncbi:unnamed protein product [Schistosoma rodhaini]|uniref:Serine/arginine-rich splicing factor 2 n=1 Tax=Schistosoma rodhaini TaxID=6188 RepID=A0AA85FG00_9TREM|nr:putative serine/arginine rich splicing factor [Schistosoma mansoni]CAH8513519.1 unnamed protein product [Schistosoma rodhaini]CAH8513543.1 unnamed protein product [Schistosoma rodhaini]|eukprot:XP_018649977.1 putative serine/arginine rich splicing factor [Schistosoma mansoni]